MSRPAERLGAVGGDRTITLGRSPGTPKPPAAGPSTRAHRVNRCPAPRRSARPEPAAIRGERLLQRHRAAQTVDGRLEGEQEAVALALDLVAVVGDALCAHDGGVRA